MAKFNNPMKVITGPDTLWSYCNVWEPKSINGSNPKYSVQLRIPKTDKVTLEKIDKERDFFPVTAVSGTCSIFSEADGRKIASFPFEFKK